MPAGTAALGQSHRRSGFAASLESTLMHPAFLPLCFLLYMGLRAALAWLVPVEPSSDFLWYHARAIDLAEGRGFTENGVPTAYWPVGWPAVAGLLYTAFGARIEVLQVANLLFAAGTFFLVLDLGRRTFGAELAARMGVLLLAIYPQSIAYVSLTSTETFYTFLLLLGCWLYIGRRTPLGLILGGLVFGYATLTKPQTLFMPAALIAISFLFENGYRLKARTLVQGGLLYLAMTLVLAPWVYRNYTVFGEPVFVSTNSGWALYVGNNPSAWASRGFPTDDGPEVKALWKETFTVANQLESGRQAKAAAIQWIRENPSTFVMLMPIKAATLWVKDGESEWAYQLGAPSYDEHIVAFRVVRIFNQVYYAFLMLGFLAAGVLLLRRILAKRTLEDIPVWALTGYAFAAYTTLQCMIMAASYRYKFPLMPFAALSCGWAIVQWAAGQPGRRP